MQNTDLVHFTSYDSLTPNVFLLVISVHGTTSLNIFQQDYIVLALAIFVLGFFSSLSVVITCIFFYAKDTQYIRDLGVMIKQRR